MKISSIINTTLANAAKRITPNIHQPKGLAQSAIQRLTNINPIKQTELRSFELKLFHKDNGGKIAFGYYPDNYIRLKSKKLVPAEPAKTMIFSGQECHMKARPAYYEELFEYLPHYHIDKLMGNGDGFGTRSVQEIVRKSLSDAETQGRVTLEAACIDDETTPGGFYYKLGFRFCNSKMNEKCAKWLADGGKKENAPFAIGQMYLPEENISQCLNYGRI